MNFRGAVMTNINVKYIPPSADTSDLYSDYWGIGITWQFTDSSISQGITAKSKVEPTISNVVALINNTLQETNNHNIKDQL